jgi:hypothetical protein
MTAHKFQNRKTKDYYDPPRLYPHQHTHTFHLRQVAHQRQLAFALKKHEMKAEENLFMKHTVLQLDRIKDYTPASFQDVGKQFLRFQCPLFALFVTHHATARSSTGTKLAIPSGHAQVGQ